MPALPEIFTKRIPLTDKEGNVTSYADGIDMDYKSLENKNTFFGNDDNNFAGKPTAPQLKLLQHQVKGYCKQGERSDLTGCTPISKEPGVAYGYHRVQRGKNTVVEPIAERKKSKKEKLANFLTVTGKVIAKAPTAVQEHSGRLAIHASQLIDETLEKVVAKQTTEVAKETASACILDIVQDELLGADALELVLNKITVLGSWKAKAVVSMGPYVLARALIGTCRKYAESFCRKLGLIKSLDSNEIDEQAIVDATEELIKKLSELTGIKKDIDRERITALVKAKLKEQQSKGQFSESPKPPKLNKSLLYNYKAFGGGSYTKPNTGTCKQGERSDLTGCTPAKPIAPKVKPSKLQEEEAPEGFHEQEQEPTKPASGKPDYVGKPISEKEFQERGVPNWLLADTKTYINQLDRDKLRHVKDYTDMSYSVLNAKMRSCPPEFGCLEGYNKQLYEGIESAIKEAPPLEEPLNVYRGLALPDPDIAKAILVEAQKYVGKDAVYKMPCITSTTLRPATAFGGFTGGDENSLAFHIKAKTGLYVDQVSGNPGEQEIIKSAHTKYKVIAVDKADVSYSVEGWEHVKHMRVIYLEEV